RIGSRIGRRTGSRALIALRQPLGDPGGCGAGLERRGVTRQQQEQAQAVLARKLAAGARAAKSRLAQIDLGAVGIFAAALAFAPGGALVAAKRRPLAGGGEPFGGAGRA